MPETRTRTPWPSRRTPARRSRLDPEIPDLLAQITDALYQQWLAEVDKLIDQGRGEFQKGEFLKAYNIVQTAESRWNEIHPDKTYSALETLLPQVTNALKLSWGRDLSPEDSRAPAVNAFLSQANASVGDAEKLKKGDPQRVVLLNKATASVRSALAVAPVYRAAKLVQFRVRKDLAPNDRAFLDDARSEIAAILKDYQARKGDRARIYYDLKDYTDIVPDYPGVKEALSQLEIELGFRIKPISPADIAAAHDKYTQASTLYNGDNALTYDPALQLLDTALNLNPGYTAARSLRMTILLKQGSPEVSSISQADLARYAKARQAYGTADYAGAYTILHDMIGTNPKNGSYAPIAKLYLLAQQKLGLK